MIGAKNTGPWIVLFFVALALRLGAAAVWEHRYGDEPFFFGDSETYWVLGKAIAEGKPYEYGGLQIHRMPGYPVVLAPIFLFFGGDPPVLAGRIENSLIGSLTVLAVVWLAGILFDNRLTSHLAGWMVALDPLNLVLSVTILSEAPFCLFMVLQLGFWARALRLYGNDSARRDFRRSIVFAGLAAAAAVYCRPGWIYFIPFAVLTGMILAPWNGRPIFRSGVVLCLLLAACLAPWWFRNFRLTGHFVPTTLQTGPTLYDGLRPNADGASEMSFVDLFRGEERRRNPALSGIQLEYRLNKILRREAIRRAWKNPKLAWKLAGKKFLRLWNFRLNEASLSGGIVNGAVFAATFPVLFLGLIGAIRSLGRDFAVRLLWIPAVYITGLHVVFVSSIRYRAPAMIGLSILAAWILADLLRFVRAGCRGVGRNGRNRDSADARR